MLSYRQRNNYETLNTCFVYWLEKLWFNNIRKKKYKLRKSLGKLFELKKCELKFQTK